MAKKNSALTIVANDLQATLLARIENSLPDDIYIMAIPGRTYSPLINNFLKNLHINHQVYVLFALDIISEIYNKAPFLTICVAKLKSDRPSVEIFNEHGKRVFSSDIYFAQHKNEFILVGQPVDYLGDYTFVEPSIDSPNEYPPVGSPIKFKLIVETNSEKLARSKRDFIEALNASPNSKEAELRDVAVTVDLGHILTATTPFQAAAASDLPQPEMPKFPKWTDRENNETVEEWLEQHYKKYIDAGLITRSFFQERNQDKTFYNHLREWEKQGNKLSSHVHIPTKSELLDRERAEMGAVPKARQLYRSSPETRQAAREYQAARRMDKNS